MSLVVEGRDRGKATTKGGCTKEEEDDDSNDEDCSVEGSGEEKSERIGALNALLFAAERMGPHNSGDESNSSSGERSSSKGSPSNHSGSSNTSTGSDPNPLPRRGHKVPESGKDERKQEVAAKSEIIESNLDLQMNEGFYLFSLAMHEHVRSKMRNDVTHKQVSVELQRIWQSKNESIKRGWISQAASLMDLDTKNFDDEDGNDMSDSFSGNFSDKALSAMSAATTSRGQMSSSGMASRGIFMSASSGDEYSSQHLETATDEKESEKESDQACLSTDSSGSSCKPSHRKQDQDDKKQGSSKAQQLSKPSSFLPPKASKQQHNLPRPSGSTLPSLKEKRASDAFKGLDKRTLALPKELEKRSSDSPKMLDKRTLESLAHNVLQGAANTHAALGSGGGALGGGLGQGFSIPQMQMPNFAGISAPQDTTNFQQQQNLLLQLAMYSQQQLQNNQGLAATLQPLLMRGAGLPSFTQQQQAQSRRPDALVPNLQHLLLASALQEHQQQQLSSFQTSSVLPLLSGFSLASLPPLDALNQHLSSLAPSSSSSKRSMPEMPIETGGSHRIGLGLQGLKRQPQESSSCSPTPQPEPPQVRTMTCVCDLFSPHKGTVNLQILSEKCEISTSKTGIIGLSCQLQTPTGNTVVKRGYVKDAKRHFLHQAQLRLSLESSPNISVKVFNNGRLQIAGCRDEASCMQAVEMIAAAFNSVLAQPGGKDIMKRTEKEGSKTWLVEGPIDIAKITRPQIVMIHCSFDSNMEALGYGVNPTALTQIIQRMQMAENSCIEEVSYTVDQRYNGVKVKYLPPSAAQRALTGGKTDREVFIGIFPSGKAVITGAVTWKEVDEAYDWARALLCENYRTIRVPLEHNQPARKKQRKGEGSGSRAGYDLEDGMFDPS